MSKILFFCSLIFLVYADDLYSKFHQTDYKIEFERVELVSYDKDVWNIMTVKTFKFNRTMPVVNMTLNAKKTMSTEIEMIVQLYKFLSNEYRICPTRFQMNFCKGLRRNIAGIKNMFKCGNFNTCKIIANTTYNICNFYVDGSRLPPFVPNGQYRVRVDYQYNNNEKPILILDFFAKVYRPITRK